MAVEIVPFRGDAAEFSAFINRVWLDAYDGKAWVPLWDEGYYAWRIFERGEATRALCLGAYRDGKLLGVIGSEAATLLLYGRPVRGAMLSYMTIDPKARAFGLGGRMVAELAGHLRADGRRLNLGLSNTKTPARAFWTSMAARDPAAQCEFGRVLSWVRIADPAAMAAAGFSAQERHGSRIAGLIPWGWTGRTGRAEAISGPPTAEDMAILRHASARADIAMDWSEDTAAHFLSHPFVRGFRHPTGQALVNAYQVTWRGRADLRVAIIDIAAHGGRPGDLVELLIGAGRALVDDGAQMIIAMDQGAAEKMAFLRAGFMPADPNTDFFALLSDPALGLRSDLSVLVPFT